MGSNQGSGEIIIVSLNATVFTFYFYTFELQITLYVTEERPLKLIWSHKILFIFSFLKENSVPF